MEWEFVLSLGISFIIVFVSAVLLSDFYYAKNGILRKLMIALFICVIFVYSSGMMIMIMQYEGFWLHLTLERFRWLTALPLACVMLRFLYYRMYEMRNKK